MSDGSTGFGIYQAQQSCADFDSKSSRSAWGFRSYQEQTPLKKTSDNDDDDDDDYVATSMTCIAQTTISDRNRDRLVLPKAPCPSPPSSNLQSKYGYLSQQQMRPRQISETATDIVFSKQSIPTKNQTAMIHAKTPSPEQPIRIESEEDIHKPLWSYLGITLKRPDNDRPWGMSVSLFDNTYLVLGHVNHEITKDSTVWSRIISIPPPPRTVFYTHQNSNRFRSDLEHLSSVQNVTPCMLPGDIVLSINGRSIPSFVSMSAVTQYLRESNEISMVLSRHRVASKEAIAVWYTQTDLTSQERMCLAAKEAYRVFRGSLGVPCKVVRKRKRNQSPSNTKKSLLPVFVASTASQVSLPQRVVLPSTARVKNSQTMHSLLYWTNPLFRDEITGKPLLYSDNGDFEWEDGLRAKQFIVPIRSFPQWLAQRKAIWRKSWKHIRQTPRQILAPYAPFRWTNPLFRDERTGQPLLYSDNDSFEWEDGLRSKYFIAPIQSFPDWLTQRRTTWRKLWKTYKFDNNNSIDPDDFSDENEKESSLVARDYWTAQGFPSFNLWLAASTEKWRRSYSWNKRKRKRIKQECEEIVHFPAEAQVWNDNAEAQLSKWLSVRKNQWRMMRRKRQRRRGGGEEEVGAKNLRNLPAAGVESHTSDPTNSMRLGVSSSLTGCIVHITSPYKVTVLSQSADMMHIDALLEEQERQRRALDERPPFDISFIFDANLGAPDDAIAHCFSFLHRSEHGKLLCISKQTSDKIKERDYLWRTLCPPHWVLPRRPRKPWHQMYITRIREEEEASRKRSDELLYKAVSSLHKGDQLLKVQKLINDGQKKFGFDINYVSGVLFERNSLLNLAVINCRHKIVKWLIETKDADLESDDRGGFTPLLNAAWEGDKHMVRYLMSKGANRTQIGTGHYSRPLAPPDFKGLTAEGWARKRGHDELASLIRLGL
mmetsp:Transcript_2127/g.3252  ORF Transcript_2127/g.3252 Transcript_2127/m.3252 type:complete len:937 (-) Transcript_2127:1800-4610(-)